MTKNTRKFRQLGVMYQNTVQDIIMFDDYLFNKRRINHLRNHIPPMSKPNQYTLSDSHSLSPRQRKKLARFKAARVCEVAGKVVVVLDSNGVFA